MNIKRENRTNKLGHAAVEWPWPMVSFLVIKTILPQPFTNYNQYFAKVIISIPRRSIAPETISLV